MTSLPCLPGTISALALKDPHPGKHLGPGHTGLVGHPLALPGEGGYPAFHGGQYRLPAVAIALTQGEGFLRARMELRESKRCCLDVSKISKGLVQVKQQPISAPRREAGRLGHSIDGEMIDRSIYI